MAKRITTEEFISRATSHHGNRYCYDNVKYVKSTIKVDIVCNHHGPFSQTPASHISGTGCPRCKGEELTKRNTLTTEEFITKSKKIHRTRYIYSNVQYKRHNIPIEILCRDHGAFHQTPNTHLNGSGCPLMFEVTKPRIQQPIIL